MNDSMPDPTAPDEPEPHLPRPEPDPTAATLVPEDESVEETVEAQNDFA